MHNDLKQMIQEAYQAPEATGRDAFLKNLNYPQLTKKDYLLLQFGYIRMRVWVVSAVVMALAMYTVISLSKFDEATYWLGGIWVVAALFPALAMITASEVSRSDTYGMLEIEASSKFGIQQLIGARLLILGIVDFVVIVVISVMMQCYTAIGIFTCALYLMAPFSVTSALTLSITRRFRGQDGIYMSTAAAFFVAIGLVYVSFVQPQYTTTPETIIACIMLVIGCVGIVMNLRTTFHQKRIMEVNC